MSPPTVKNPNSLSLPAHAEEILARMFAGYHELVVLQEFGGGYNGRVFLVRPIRQDRVAELPAVVKLAPVSLIEQEGQAYRNFVHEQLPNVAPMKGKPVLSPDRRWGGLRYGLVGSGRFEIESLHDYCRHASIDDIQRVLTRLFKIIEPWWQSKQHLASFRMKDSYDRILPANLALQPGPPPSNVAVHTLNAGAIPDLQTGDWVRLGAGVVKKINRSNHTVLLDLLPPTDELQTTCHMWLEDVQSIEFYQSGSRVPAITGQIMATRAGMLYDCVQAALPAEIDLTAATINLPGGPALPNPLLALPALLQEFRDIHASPVHGDLNLENVLVDKETGDVNLIDFGLTGRNHIFHDLLRLEAEVTTKLVPEAMQAAELPLRSIVAFYGSLHDAVQDSTVAVPEGLEKPFAILLAIRKMAARHLFTQDDWAEYYQGLTVYLLGFLRFPSLDEEAKRIAFYGAALAQRLIEGSMTYKEYNSPPILPPASEESDSRASANHIDNRSGVFFGDKARIEGDVITGGMVTKTEFHGPVTGPIHTGSGGIHASNWQRPQPDRSSRSLQGLLDDLRRQVRGQAQGQVKSQALRRIDTLAGTITDEEPDLGMLESTVAWFHKHLPFLSGTVLAIVSHPTIQDNFDTAGEPVSTEFKRRLSRWQDADLKTS